MQVRPLISTQVYVSIIERDRQGLFGESPCTQRLRLSLSGRCATARAYCFGLTGRLRRASCPAQPKSAGPWPISPGLIRSLGRQDALLTVNGNGNGNGKGNGVFAFDVKTLERRARNDADEWWRGSEAGLSPIKDEFSPVAAMPEIWH